MRKRPSFTVALAACAACLVGCSSSAATSSGTASSGTTGSAAGTLQAGSNNSIVFFAIGLANAYVVNFQKGLLRVTGKYGYKVTTIDTNLSQTTANSDVQQFLATGKKPAAFVWEPIDPTVGSNSSRQLARVAPVFQASQLPLDAGALGYAASNQVEIGYQMGVLAMQARTYLEQHGVKLHSKQGNVLYIDGLTTQPAAIDRYQGFMAATKSAPFNIIGHVYGAVDADTAYTAAAPAITRDKSQGIDIVVSFNLDTAPGVIRAASQNGITFGQKTLLVTGDCGGGEPSLLSDGKVFGTIVVSGYFEGEIVGQMVVQYLATHKIKSGTVTLPASATQPPITVTPPTRFTFMSTPIATAQNLNTMYWGQTYAGACLGAP